MSTSTGQDTLQTRRTLSVDANQYEYFSLQAAAEKLDDISRLPFSLKVLLENMLRYEDGQSVTVEDALAFGAWLKNRKISQEIAYRPARVLMQDFTGVPAVVDLAAMREAMVALGGDAQKINPMTPVDLVIDHSVMVDEFASGAAFKHNVEKEFKRNGERYEFLRWGQDAFDNFRVVPPGTGICHQVNLEYLGQTVWVDTDERSGRMLAYPDTLVGTDSHTTMINGLSILGWGVGGIEAEAAMLGQPVSMMIPDVIGFELLGKLQEGTTATDLVLTVTQMLREKGVVGKFVEFFGTGLDHLRLADRATLSNMAPEYGATCGFFPIDTETLRYLQFTGRDPHRIRLVEQYAREQGLWRDADSPNPLFTDTLSLDMGTVTASISGPKRPQDKILLSQAAKAFSQLVSERKKEPVQGADYSLQNGAIVIAAITSCTNTSNPSVMLAAGLVARKAREKGLQVKPWVKTSLAPGSQVVTDYLRKAGLQDDLDALGFNLVGYGCTTCIGNSGPLAEPLVKAVEAGDLTVTAVLSGNRNFEGRINPHVKANYLASPPLVVAYALAGSMRTDLFNEPLGQDHDGNDVFLRDIWPSNAEIAQTVDACVTREMFEARYANVFAGPAQWRAIRAEASETFAWNDASTYVKKPPFFTDMQSSPEDITDIQCAYALAVLGDSVTTDHISPAGAIKLDSPAGAYLRAHHIEQADFNSFGSRRGNHEVMMRGTFGNIRIKNEMLPGTEGGVTKHIPSGEQMPIYDAAMRYAESNTPLVVIAGKEYGTGSSRDWAAKGIRLLGVKAVIAESYERIHRSNLVGMGVLPLQFLAGASRQALALDGTEIYDVSGLESGITPGMELGLTIYRGNGEQQHISLLCRIDTLDEVAYFKNSGILHYVLRNFAA